MPSATSVSRPPTGPAIHLDWPRVEEAAALRSAGVASRTGVVWLDSPQWQHRRVDTVEFGDATTIRMRSSIDFTVPEQAAVLHRGEGPPLRVLPLALLRKAPLVDFDLWDEGDRVLPMLTAEQNGALAAGMLLALAETVLSAPPRPALAADIEAIAMAPTGAGEPALAALGNAAADVVEDDQRSRLRASMTFVILARQLAFGFLMTVLLEDPPGTRRVLKFRRELWIELGALEGRSSLTAALGWTPTPARTSANQALDAASYHFEVAAPPGVEITGLRLLVRRPGQMFPDTSRTRVAGGRQRAHATLPSVPTGSKIGAVVELRAERRGWLRASWILSLVAFALISLLLARGSSLSAVAADGRGQVAQSAAVLLGLNGVLAALLVRSGEHALAARLLSKLRVAALASAALPFVVAVTLVFGPGGGALSWLLRGYFLVALVAAAVLTLAYVLPRAPQSLSVDVPPSVAS